MPHVLTHFRFCPASRAIRLALAEHDMAVTLTEARPWEWRPELLALNPAGELPVLAIERGPLLCGSYAISEYLAETAPGTTASGDADRTGPKGLPALALFPGSAEERAEARRLVDWFQAKFSREVTGPLLEARVRPLLDGAAPAAPDAALLRAVRANLAHHLAYAAFLIDQRNWLAGDALSFADLAAAAHLSCLDYLGEVPWEQHPGPKAWYQRLKSRRAFQSLLVDRLPGCPPPRHYTDVDF